jgi:glycosyltransferase involved in cell wall biosynthesis
MRVLWVKMGGLWPTNTGGRQRSFQLIAELSRRHRVVVLTTHGPGDEPDGLANHLAECERVVSLPYVPPKRGTARFVAALARSWASSYPVDLWKWRVAAVRDCLTEMAGREPFDAIVSDFLFSAANVPFDGPAPVVFFEHNVEYLIWKRLADVERQWWRRVLLNIEWRKVRRCEARACSHATMTIAVSDDDRARLQADAPAARTTTIPTGVDVAYFRPQQGPEIPSRLVFSGSMDWYPNEDAVLFWAHEMLPRVRREIPTVSLTVVGRNPGPRVRALASEAGIHVTGTVADVRPYIAESSLYVVPLRVGGGTRLKIFEALAMGKPVLSTTVGAEGLGVTPGQHLVLADGPDAFSAAVVELLRDPARRAALGAAGRQLVEERYAWPRVARIFEGHLLDAASQRSALEHTAECRAAVS